jgi:hypothetical protein
VARPRVCGKQPRLLNSNFNNFNVDYLLAPDSPRRSISIPINLVSNLLPTLRRQDFQKTLLNRIRE